MANDMQLEYHVDADYKGVLQMEKAVNKSTKSIDKSFTLADKAASKFGGTISSIASGVSLGLLAGKLISVQRNFDKLNASLITSTGSIEGAAEALGILTKFAAETPYSLDQAINGFNKLVALGLTPSERALRAYGNTAAAMGKDLQQMIEAVADASVAEFERLKEFGIKAKNQGDTIAFTFQGVTTEVKNSADAIEGYLIKLGETKFGDAMENRVKTLDGAMSNLEDSWNRLFLTISQSSIGGLIEGQVRHATEAINTLSSGIRVLFGDAQNIKEVDRQLLGVENRLKSLNLELKGKKEYGGGLLAAFGMGRSKQDIIDDIDKEIKTQKELIKQRTDLANSKDKPLELTVSPTLRPSATPSRGGDTSGGKKQKSIDRGLGLNDLGLESTATGMSNAIIAENETVFDELNRQRDLIKEFQDLEIGDAEAHSAALIAIDKKEADERMKIDSMVYSAAANGFGAMADLVGAFAGESSGAYKALFAVSKSFAIANAAIQMQTAIANASALPYPANLPAIGQAVAAGGQIASTLSSISYGGGRRYGGGVSAGRMYEVGESGAEMFTSGGKNYMLPGKDGSVTSNSNMGGGGVVVNQVFNVEASATYDQNAMAQLMSATKNQTLAIMQEQSRPGGMIAK